MTNRLHIDLNNSAKEKMENVHDVHNKIAKTFKKRFGEEWDNKEAIDKFISALKKDNPRPRVLELGCGWGYHLNYLCKNGIDAEGVDFSERLLKIAKREFPHIIFHQMDALEIGQNFEPGSFDGIMAIFFLHFIPHTETEKLWQNICRLLKPNGKFFAVAMVGAGGEQMTFSSSLPETTKIRLFTNTYSQQKLKAILAENHFKIDFWHSVPKVEKEVINGDGKVVFMATKN